MTLANQSRKILAVVALSSILVGCSDASTTVKKGSSTLFTVGDTKITKEEVYDATKISEGADYTVDKIKSRIENAEIKSKKKINNAVEELYQKYVSAYGDEESLLSQLTNYGYDDAAEFKKNQLEGDAKEDVLEQKYLKLKKDKYFKEYKPSIVKVLAVKNKKKAHKALEALNSGTSWDDVYSQYSSDDSSYENEQIILTTSSSGFESNDVKTIYKKTKEGVINQSFKTSTTGSSTRFIVNVVSVDRDGDSNFADITTAIVSADDDFSSDMWSYYMKKHKVSLHDQYIFDYLRENNPEYLYQYPELKEADSDND